MLSSKKYKNCPYCGEKILDIAIKCKHCGSFLGNSDILSEGDLFLLHSKILGRKYDLIEIVGKGGMATVYKAYHKYLKRFEAIKVLNQQFLVDAEVKERFFREAQLISYLEHPNIVKIFDIDTFDQITFIAMEYINGEDLYTILKKGFKFSIENFINIFLQILDALEHAHKKGIIHRDIKSSNILLQYDEEKNIKKAFLTDFGIAYVKKAENILGYSPLTKKGEIFGTPEFMSPEQISGDTEIDERSDIFSLGVVMYHTLTNSVPFNDSSVMKLIFKVVNSQYTPLNNIRNDLPHWLVELVHKCLEVDRSNRFSSCEEIKMIIKNKMYEIDNIINANEEFKTKKIVPSTIENNPLDFVPDEVVMNETEPTSDIYQESSDFQNIIVPDNHIDVVGSDTAMKGTGIEGDKNFIIQSDEFQNNHIKEETNNKQLYNQYQKSISKPILISLILVLISTISLVIYFFNFLSGNNYNNPSSSKPQSSNFVKKDQPLESYVNQYDIDSSKKEAVESIDNTENTVNPDNVAKLETKEKNTSKGDNLLIANKDDKLVDSSIISLSPEEHVENVVNSEKDVSQVIEKQLSEYLLKGDYQNLFRVYNNQETEIKNNPAIKRIVNTAYQNLVRLGDEFFNKKMYKEALNYYNMAQKLDDNYLIKSKKTEVERIISREK